MRYSEVIEGYPLVAMCEIYHNEYAYALYDTKAKEGDRVTVTGKCSNVYPKITKIMKADEYDGAYDITACVVGIIDTSAYDSWAEKAEKLEEIRAKMEERKVAIERRKTDEVYASMDDEYKKLLDELKAVENM